MRGACVNLCHVCHVDVCKACLYPHRVCLFVCREMEERLEKERLEREEKEAELRRMEEEK